MTPDGRRVPVRRLRVRSVGADQGEVTLDSYRAFAGADLLAEGIVARMLAGSRPAATRSRLSRFGDAVEQAATSISKASVSRRFGAATVERLAELCARPAGRGALTGRDA